MNPLRSFRLRLVVGLFLGAMGLLALTHMVTVFFVRKYRMVVHADSAVIVGSLALLFLVVGLLQIRRGLSPFERLRARLAAVRQGRDRHVDGSYPTEVQPLVNDLNALLDHREAAVARASRRRATSRTG